MPKLTDIVAQKAKFLLLSPPGGGKTRMAGTFDHPYFFVFDDGLMTLLKLVKDGRIKEGDFDVFVDTDRYSLSGLCWMDFNKKYLEVLKDPKYKTVVLDGWSMLTTYGYNYFQAINANVDKPGGFHIYGLLKSHLEDKIRLARRYKKFVVVTALTEAIKDENLGTIGLMPKTVGSIGDEMGAWFDEIYYPQRTNYKGKMEYRVRTRPSGIYTLAKTRLDCVDDLEVPDFRVIKAKVKQHLGVDWDAEDPVAEVSPPAPKQGGTGK